ncbi:hypothetical protein FA039_30690 [Escherichia coli]|nr:hypothetical protein [Escherichia coli]
MKNPDSLMHHHSADRQPPQMPICQRCSHCERKIIIMARFDIDTGGYPVQRRTKIAGCGFNLPDIRNPLFREPELKLYRRIINRKMRRGGYLKIARRQLNPRRRCRCGNPERYRRRIALLPHAFTARTVSL